MSKLEVTFINSRFVRSGFVNLHLLISPILLITILDIGTGNVCRGRL